MVRLQWMPVGLVTAAALALAPVDAAHALLITGVTASTGMGSFSGSNIQNTVNGVGLPGNTPSLTGDHAVADSSNAWISSVGTTTGNINFDLGGEYSLQGFSFWNFNSFDPPGPGIKDVNIFTSLDNITYTLLSGAPTVFNRGVAFNLEPPQTFSFSPVLARYVRFQVLSNYGGSTIGFDEVQFFDSTSTPIPTPALVPGLLGLGGAIWRKRRAEAAEARE